MKAKSPKTTTQATAVPVTKIVKATTTKAKPAEAVVVKAIIEPAVIDVHIAYNSAGRFPKASYQTAASKAITVQPEFKTKGYLVTTGSKGKLINEVEFDPTLKVYRRKHGNSHLYGHVSSLMESDTSLHAELLTVAQLAQQVLKFGKVFRFKRRESGDEQDYAVLNKSTDSYVVGVHLDAKDHITVHNIEPVAKHNAKAVQFVQLRDITDGKMLRRFTTLRTAKA